LKKKIKNKKVLEIFLVVNFNRQSVGCLGLKRACFYLPLKNWIFRAAQKLVFLWSKIFVEE